MGGKWRITGKKIIVGKKKTVEDLPSVLFSIQVLLGSEQAFVPWKFTSSLKKKSLVAMEIPSLHDESFLKVEDIGKTKCKLFWGFFNDVSDKSGWSRENSSPPKNHSWYHHLHVRNIK